MFHQRGGIFAANAADQIGSRGRNLLALLCGQIRLCDQIAQYILFRAILSVAKGDGQRQKGGGCEHVAIPRVSGLFSYNISFYVFGLVYFV
jgi:hypothetical protein